MLRSALSVPRVPQVQQARKESLERKEQPVLLDLRVRSVHRDPKAISASKERKVIRVLLG